MAKAIKKALAGKAAAPKKAVKAVPPPKKAGKAAAPKKALKAVPPKKGSKAAATKKSMAPVKAVPAKKGFKAVAPKKASKAAAPKKASLPQKSKGVSSDQRPMLEALFIDHLKDIYWAEKHLSKALPKMSKAATSPDLKQAFDEHLQVTNQQVTRLEQVFEMLGKKAQGKKCDAMTGLVMEADSVISDTEKGSSTRDVGLIIAAQKVEHYEIASYGGLATLARTLGMEDAKNLLGQTLQEEKQTDELLTQLAENNINQKAEEEGGSEETEKDEDDADEGGIELDPKEEKEGTDSEEPKEEGKVDQL